MFIKVIRGFDAIFYASLVLIFLLVRPNILGQPDFFCLLPVLILLYSAWRLPKTFYQIEDWEKTIFRFRAFSLSCAGLFPFVIWWFRVPENTYIMLNAWLAMLTGIGWMFQLNVLMFKLAAFSGNKDLEIEAKMTQIMVFFLLFIPAITLLLVLGIDSFLSSRTAIGDIYYLLRICPGWAFLFLLVPIVFSLSLMLRTRLSLIKQFQTICRDA